MIYSFFLNEINKFFGIVHAVITLCLRFENPATWKARSPYLYPPRTGWPSYTPRYWVPFSSPPTTHKATVLIILWKLLVISSCTWCWHFASRPEDMRVVNTMKPVSPEKSFGSVCVVKYCRHDCIWRRQVRNFSETSGTRISWCQRF
jgi:hypothetical protein